MVIDPDDDLEEEEEEEVVGELTVNPPKVTCDCPHRHKRALCWRCRPSRVCIHCHCGVVHSDHEFETKDAAKDRALHYAKAQLRHLRRRLSHKRRKKCARLDEKEAMQMDDECTSV